MVDNVAHKIQRKAYHNVRYSYVSEYVFQNAIDNETHAMLRLNTFCIVHDAIVHIRLSSSHLFLPRLLK